MSDVGSGHDDRWTTLTRRTLLGAATAALLTSRLPVTTRAGAGVSEWVAEVRVPTSPRAIQADDPLPSWNEGPRKQAIHDFVAAATDQQTNAFVPVADRIATFDMDGTLWVEMPLYTQSTYTFDRIKALAARNPEWKTTEPFATVLTDDLSQIAQLDNADYQAIYTAANAGMSMVDYEESVGEWLASAKHPRFDRRYTDLTYVPMLEVMAYLREHDFRTYIVSGSGQEFMRVYAEQVFGVPPEQIIGTTFELKYEMGSDGVPTMLIDSAAQLDNNFGGKPEDISLFIGRRPAAAFGNSTGDQQMLEWAGAGERATLMMLVFHDDPVREYAYGPAGGLPNTHIGTFTTALMDEADERGWQVISMKDDWKQIFSFEE